MNTISHRLAAGVVITNHQSEILLVRDKHGWSLPKGSTEEGETTKETAVRELKEETGFGAHITGIAFIIEYRSEKHGQYLQIYYSGETSDREFSLEDPDHDIMEAKFVPSSHIRQYLKFIPWVLSLEDWIQEPVMKYRCFDLDVEGFYIS